MDGISDRLTAAQSPELRTRSGSIEAGADWIGMAEVGESGRGADGKIKI